MQRLNRLFAPVGVPQEYKPVFSHYFQEIAWWGLLNGSTLNFISIYLTRLGGTPLQIGLLTAAPGIVSLIFSLPSGKWLARRPLFISVAIGALGARLWYLAFAISPFFFRSFEVQAWIVIIITLIMNIPGTATTIGFNSMFAEVVPIEYRGYVVGIRNAILSLVTTVASIGCGYLLEAYQSNFPAGYQIVFLIGFIGAMMSLFHVAQIRPVKKAAEIPSAREAKEPEILAAPTQDRPISRPRLSLPKLDMKYFRLEVLKGKYGKMMGLAFFFHLGQYLAIPVFPLYTVNVLHYNDHLISINSAMFQFMVFVGSLRLDWLTKRLGNQKSTAIGVMLLSLYPIVVSVAFAPWVYFVASTIGGLAWSIVGGALYNYLLEFTPEIDRSSYVAWYMIISNAAILVGSLGGPMIASIIGLGTALFLFGVVRLLAGISIYRWG